LGTHLGKNREKPVEFDISYIVRHSGDEPEIVMFVDHMDEQEKIKELGLINN